MRITRTDAETEDIRRALSRTRKSLWIVEEDDKVRCAYQPAGEPQCAEMPTDWRAIPVGEGQIIALLCDPHARLIGMNSWTDRERRRRNDASDHDHRPS